MLSTINYLYSKDDYSYVSDPSKSFRWKICAVVDALVIASFHRSIFNGVQMTASQFTSVRIEKTARIALYGIGGVAALFGIKFVVQSALNKYKEIQQNKRQAEQGIKTGQENQYREEVRDLLSALIKATVKDPQNKSQLEELCQKLSEFYKTVKVCKLSIAHAEDKNNLFHYMATPKVLETRAQNPIKFISISRDADKNQIMGAFRSCFPTGQEFDGESSKTLGETVYRNTNQHTLHQLEGVYFRFQGSKGK